MNKSYCTMKREKGNHAFGLSLLSLCLFGCSLWLSCYLPTILAAVAVIVLLLVPSIVFLCKSARKENYSICSLILNSFTNGVVVAIYYIKIQTTPMPFDFLALLLPAVLLLLAYLLIGVWQKGWRWFNLLLILLHIALIIVTVVRWVRFGGTFYSLTVFGLIFSMIYSFVFAVSIHRPERPVHRAMAIGSFGVLGIVATVVILLIFDGEGIDGVFDGLGDLIGDALPSRKKHKP